MIGCEIVDVFLFVCVECVCLLVLMLLAYVFKVFC